MRQVRKEVAAITRYSQFLSVTQVSIATIILYIKTISIILLFESHKQKKSGLLISSDFYKQVTWIMAGLFQRTGILSLVLEIKLWMFEVIQLSIKTNFYALLGYQKNVTNMFKNRSLKRKVQIMWLNASHMEEEESRKLHYPFLGTWETGDVFNGLADSPLLPSPFFSLSLSLPLSFSLSPFLKIQSKASYIGLNVLMLCSISSPF